MATWVDICALFVTMVVTTGAVYCIVTFMRQLAQSVEATKESLKNKGLTVSEHGVSVKTDGRFDREDYLGATQRGLIKALGAATYGNPEQATEKPVLRFQEPPSSPKADRFDDDKRHHILGVFRGHGREH